MTTLPVSPASGEPPASLGSQLLGQMADALAWPLLVVWADGLLVHANLAGRRLLQAGSPLQLSTSCHVQATAPQWQPELAAALSAAANQQQRSVLQWQQHATGAALLTLAPLRRPLPPRRQQQQQQQQQQQEDQNAQRAAGAPVLLAVTLRDSQAADLQAFAAAHALTDAETRVLHRLAQADSSPRAALALGVAQATVRSQTASLRRKTGHANGADLVRALALLPPTAATAATAAERH